MFLEKNNLWLFINFAKFLFYSFILVAYSNCFDRKKLPPTLQALDKVNVYYWDILKDYVEYFNSEIENIRQNYPSLEYHIKKGQWFSIVDVLECEYDDEKIYDTIPARIKISDLSQNINLVRGLWEENQFITVSLNRIEFTQHCLGALQKLIHHPNVIIQGHDPTRLKSICNDASDRFFTPAILFDEINSLISKDNDRYSIATLKCIDQERIRYGQWSAIVHLHALDLEDGRDRVFGDLKGSLNPVSQGSEYTKPSSLPYFPPPEFSRGVEHDNFVDSCMNALLKLYTRQEDPNILLKLYCKDAKKVYFSNTHDLVKNLDVYGMGEIDPISVSELRYKVGQLTPPSTLLLNIFDYRLVRIGQWQKIAQQIVKDHNSVPPYDRVRGIIYNDPRNYGYNAGLTFEEMIQNCEHTLRKKVMDQNKKGQFLDGKTQASMSKDIDEEWEWASVIELVEVESFCKDAAGAYFDLGKEYYSIPRQMPLIPSRLEFDPGFGLTESYIPPQNLDLNRQRSTLDSSKINNLDWRIEASSILWNTMDNLRLSTQLENLVTNIQWKKIIQQAKSFVFFEIGIDNFYNTDIKPPRSIFHYSNDPIEMYNQCLHAFSEARRTLYHRKFRRQSNLSMESLLALGYIMDSVDESQTNSYKWIISSSIAQGLQDKGITSNNIEEYPEFINPVKQSMCMESAKEYFENAESCPFVQDEISKYKFQAQSVFPHNPVPNADDPKLADPSGDLEAEDQWNFLYDYSVYIRNKNDENINIILIPQKMPLSFIDFRHSLWRPPHECLQDMVINCIQASWPIVEANWRKQKVQTDLATALAIFCDSASLEYFERKRQWRQLVNLIMKSQKYAEHFTWLRRGFYMPRQFEILKIPLLTTGKEGPVSNEAIQRYSEILDITFSELVYMRYLAPFTTELYKLTKLIACDMSQISTRGSWVGLIPVDAEVLRYTETILAMGRMESNNLLESKAIGFQPLRGAFDPRFKLSHRTKVKEPVSFRRNQDDLQSLSMSKLRPPQKTTVSPRVRLMQYKEIVEKDQDDLPFQYPLPDEVKIDWRKYKGGFVDTLDLQNMPNKKVIHDFINVDWLRPKNMDIIFSDLKGSRRLQLKAIQMPRRRPFYDNNKGTIFYDTPSTPITERGIEPRGRYPEPPGRFPVTDGTLHTGYRVTERYREPYKIPNKILPPDPALKSENFIPIPELPIVKRKSLKELRELAKSMDLQTEENIKLEIPSIKKYLSQKVVKKGEKYNDIEIDDIYGITTRNRKNHLSGKITSEIIHNIIKAAEYYKIKADCIPPYGYTLGETINREEDAMRGARFVYRCLRMDNHFITAKMAFKIWIRSLFLRRNFHYYTLPGYRANMKPYIKRRSRYDDQTYCPGKNQDKLDAITDSLATAAYSNYITNIKDINKLCSIAEDFLYKRVKTISNCVSSFKKNYIDDTKQPHLNLSKATLVCSQFENEWGTPVYKIEKFPDPPT
ncbi:hypothetical protein cand_011790 [Cryptosporidium andersoni]|uniref:Uncharacterized protein n=1 Tax=Cryptosporidium andersoni TaxID=117008 RepID=A0A1J4MGR4_9CRYT|nr:hypothetical protein cand_011790 [Cryptosporidium andersoni]